MVVNANRIHVILFPNGPGVSQLRPDITTLAKQSREVAARLLKSLSLSLGLSIDHLTNSSSEMFTERSMSKLRSLYYPPILESRIEEGWIRCGEHTGKISRFSRHKNFNQKYKY